MKYEELVERVRKATQNVKISRVINHLAFQINIEGEAEGAFYIEIESGKIYVEPYEYYDRDVIIVTTADIFLKIVEGKLQAMAAFTNGDLKVYGNVELIKFIPVYYDGKDVKVEETKDEEVVKVEEAVKVEETANEKVESEKVKK